MQVEDVMLEAFQIVAFLLVGCDGIGVGWDKADFLGNSTLASLALCLCPICGGFWWSPPEDGQEWRGNVVRRWEGPRGGKRAEKL